MGRVGIRYWCIVNKVSSERKLSRKCSFVFRKLSYFFENFILRKEAKTMRNFVKNDFCISLEFWNHNCKVRNQTSMTKNNLSRFREEEESSHVDCSDQPANNSYINEHICGVMVKRCKGGQGGGIWICFFYNLRKSQRNRKKSGKLTFFFLRGWRDGGRDVRRGWVI